VGIECREADQAIMELLAPLHHQPTAWRVTAERAMNRRLEGGCQVPIAAYADFPIGEERLLLQGLVGRPDGSLVLRAQGNASPQDAEGLGVSVADDLLAQGAAAILADVYGA